MSPHLEQRLVDAFPLLYAEWHQPIERSAMGWGFTCGDGWFALLWELSDAVNTLIQREPEPERADYRAIQVKEKLGTLQFYMRRSTEALDRVIADSEPASAHVCDACGAPGVLRKGPGLWRTRCAAHDYPTLAYGPRALQA